MSSYLREDLSNIPNIGVTEVKDKIRKYLTGRMDTPIESVQISESLDDEKVEVI
jgi:hypothetical protein